MMVPYLRRIHHTLESWRLGRDDEGLKYNATDWMQYLDGLEVDFDASNKEDGKKWNDWKAKAVSDNQDSSAPATVLAVQGLEADVRALSDLFEKEMPQQRLVRGTAVMREMYGFGDASGSGFGASWKKRGNIKYRFCLWGSDLDESTSNHCELRSLADMVNAWRKMGTSKAQRYSFFSLITRRPNGPFSKGLRLVVFCTSWF